MFQFIRSWLIGSAAGLCGCGTLPFGTPISSNVPAALVLPGGDAQASFLLHSNFVIVDVTLNGSGPFKFILDTGAGVTVISPAVAELLPQVFTGTTNIISNVDPNSVNAPMIKVDELGLGSIKFQSFQAAILPPITLRDGDQAVVSQGIVGVLLFRNVVLTIDYPQRIVRVQNGVLPAVDDCMVLPVERGANDLSLLRLDVEGRSVQAVIDTGNNEFLLLPESFKNLPFIGATTTNTATTVTGTLQTVRGTLNGSVSIGCLRFPSPTLILGGGVASLGGRALQPFVFTLDQSSNRVRLRP